MAKLIIGCGYLGSRVAALWRARGEEVFAATRRPEHAAELRAAGMQPILCDVMDSQSLQQLPSADTVLYCVGLDRTAGFSMRQVYVDGLANVLDRLPGFKSPSPLYSGERGWGEGSIPTKTPHPQPLSPEYRGEGGKSRRLFIYVSSTSVYGQTGGEEVDENAATEPLDESGRVVLEAERLLQTRRPDAVILRFAGIYGPGRLLRQRDLEAGRPLAVDPEKWLNLIHVEDGAAAILAAEAGARPGQIYNISDGQPVQRRVFYTQLARFLHAPEPWFVPAAPTPRDLANRRIRNERMRNELQVELKFPGCREGLQNQIEARSLSN